jgi:hypothetical protein
MEDESFNHRLSVLFMSDAAVGIPDDTSVLHEIDQRFIRRRWIHRQPLLLASGLTIIALALLLSITPARARVAQLLPFGWIQRFGTVLVTPTPSTPPGIERGKKSGATPQAQGGGLMPRLTLAEAQRQAAFPIYQPGYLPDGVTFRYAFVAPDGRTVVLSYGRADTRSAGMGIQIEQGMPIGGYEVPAAAAQTVKVNGRDAVYWNRGADIGLLSWQSSGFTYVFQWSGLALSRADIIRVAESLP